VNYPGHQEGEKEKRDDEKANACWYRTLCFDSSHI